jgi:hypothetical protein
MLPAVHAFDEVCVALPVAVALTGSASHRISSPFIFRQERAVGSGLFSLPTAHQRVRKTLNILPSLHKPDNCKRSYTSCPAKTGGKNGDGFVKRSRSRRASFEARGVHQVRRSGDERRTTRILGVLRSRPSVAFLPGKNRRGKLRRLCKTFKIKACKL